MDDNIFSKLFNLPDEGYDFKEEALFRYNNYDYFLELVLLWSLKLVNKNEINNFAKQISYKLTFYFESDPVEMYNKFIIMLDKNIYDISLYSLGKIYNVIFELNNNIGKYIKEKCDKFSLDKENELAKFIVLNSDFLCLCFIDYINRKPELLKDIGIFKEKLGIFKRDTPKKFLNSLNLKINIRKIVFDKYKDQGVLQKQAEKMTEEELPFSNIMEKIWWYKANFSNKKLIGESFLYY